VSIEDRARAFYDAIAGSYDAFLEAPEARRHRQCFWEMVAPLLPTNARLLDFGAGTGLDAQYYASVGHRVTAYDISPGMIEVLTARCAACINDGSIRPIVGTLDDLRAAVATSVPFDAVLCNFAVLSLIQDLHPVLRFFGTVVRPGGRLILSLQNPWFIGDLKTRAFWHAWWTFARVGVLRYKSAETGFTWRHLPVQVRRAARPEFRTIGVPPRPRAQCRHSFGTIGVFRLMVFERA
jgi:SAM-dependent methyltransferase